MLKDKAHVPFPDLRGIAFVLVNYSILSRNGGSGKSGAVNPLGLLKAWQLCKRPLKYCYVFDIPNISWYIASYVFDHET